MTNILARTLVALAATSIVAGCASSPVQQTQAPMIAPAVAPASDSVPLAVRWFRSSAEMRAVYIESYRTATSIIERKSAGLAAGTWGVILDGDETVLDNSLFEQESALAHRAYSEALWNEWVRSERATALPGSIAFTSRVHSLGGRVVIVTNRADAVCDATRDNFRKIGVPVDEVLCQPAGEHEDKNPRFQAVITGTAPSTLPAMKVLMWVGDNIQDFPGLWQKTMRAADASAFADFGDRFIALPNPMYGSWTANYRG